MLSRLEGIIPAIESAHAVAYAIKLARERKKGSILVNLSGRGDKDMEYIIEKYGILEKIAQWKTKILLNEMTSIV